MVCTSIVYAVYQLRTGLWSGERGEFEVVTVVNVTGYNITTFKMDASLQENMFISISLGDR
jgi:hypothetical protein